MSRNFLTVYILLYIFIICDAKSNPIYCDHENNEVCCEEGYKYINNYCVKIHNINNDKLYFDMNQYYIIIFIIIGIYYIIH